MGKKYVWVDTISIQGVPQLKMVMNKLQEQVCRIYHLISKDWLKRLIPCMVSVLSGKRSDEYKSIKVLVLV